MLLFPLLWGTLLLLLSIATITDIKWGLIPDSLVVLGISLALIEHIYYQGVLRGLFISLFGGVVLTFIGFVLYATNKFGGGDIKLFIMISCFTGLQGMAGILFSSFVVQTLVFIVAFARGNMELKKPFAPAIFFGSLSFMLVSIFWLRL
jgi:Flp pilus assembly protein protease CpaA